VIALGSPPTVARIVAELAGHQLTCFQLDLYQSNRLKSLLAERGLRADVVTAADLWSLDTAAATVIYPVADKGERDLKLDMVEQSFHVLRDGGLFIVSSPYERDLLFARSLKKVFGRFHTLDQPSEQIFWSRHQADRPRRRHEVTFQVRTSEGESLRFLSRPGVFSYGRFDHGARALVETLTIQPGERILDVGCGCGTNGIIAGLRSGPRGSDVFVDSNLRALELAQHNARENGLVNVEVVATHEVEVAAGSFDVALANRPYFAGHSIARLFVEKSAAALRRSGRFYVVTKQPNQVGPFVEEAVGEYELVARRGCTVLCAIRG
jgi:16S rRNA (guanine1207-N2)-methyltransferase